MNDMKHQAKAYVKPSIEVVPLQEPLLQTVLPGSNVGIETWGKEYGFEEKEDLGRYFYFNDPWEK